MIILQSSPRRKVNPYRLVRTGSFRLLKLSPFGIPFPFWYYAIKTGGFDLGATGDPAALAAFAVMTTIYAVTAIVVMNWKHIAWAYNTFTLWWKRQESKYDRIED